MEVQDLWTDTVVKRRLYYEFRTRTRKATGSASAELSEDLQSTIDSSLITARVGKLGVCRRTAMCRIPLFRGCVGAFHWQSQWRPARMVAEEFGIDLATLTDGWRFARAALTQSCMTPNELVSSVLPQFFPSHWLADADIVHSHFPSRIRVGYVLRAGGEYRFVMKEEVDEQRTSIDELHAAALENLSQLPSASFSIGNWPTGAEGWISAGEDNFAAARILLPQVQQMFLDELGDSFLIALSHRDDCFCWSATQEPERQRDHARAVLERFLDEDYNLTPDILQYKGGAIGLYIEQPVEKSQG